MPTAETSRQMLRINAVTFFAFIKSLPVGLTAGENCSFKKYYLKTHKQSPKTE